MGFNPFDKSQKEKIGKIKTLNLRKVFLLVGFVIVATLVFCLLAAVGCMDGMPKRPGSTSVGGMTTRLVVS